MSEIKVILLVERWLSDNVEIDSVDVNTIQNGSVNFIELLKKQKVPNDGLPSYHLGSVLQKAFQYKHDTKFSTTSYDAFGDLKFPGEMDTPLGL